MTLFQTIRGIEAVALSQPTIKTIVQNDVFRLNAIPNVKYGVFAWTQGQHTIGVDLNTYAFTFFYVDRLTEDKGNEIEVQSVGVQTLGNILRTLEAQGVFPVTGWTAQTFNQRFLDECAGVFASVRFEVPAGDICPETWPEENENDNNENEDNNG